MTLVRIPYNWTPRDYQADALDAFKSGKRRQMHIWHRRAGKDAFALNLVAIEAFKTVGTYWIIYPTQTQARTAIWREPGLLDNVFPEAIRKTTRDAEMMIELVNGSVIKFLGADKDRLVGANTRGIVFSEWALINPIIWQYLAPIIVENKGWAVFITTYRGKNHAYTDYERHKNDPEWFCSLKTIDDTRRADGSPVVTLDDIEKERREGKEEPYIQQEYWCSPVAAFTGAYYGKQIRKMHEEGRVCPVMYDSSLPVYVSMDLGWIDHTTAVFFQVAGNETHIIGSRYWKFTTTPEIVHDIRNGFPWGRTISYCALPHDAANANRDTGSTLG